MEPLSGSAPRFGFIVQDKICENLARVPANMKLLLRSLVQELAGNLKSVKKLRNTSLVVECSTDSYSRNLLKGLDQLNSEELTVSYEICFLIGV